MARQTSPLVSLTPSLGAARPAGIGHNGGPPLDGSGAAFIWRRAVAQAWKTPSREIALRRLRRADELGLSYREYTSVLMDRGRNLDVAIFAPGTLLRETAGCPADGHPPAVPAAPALAKLGAIRNCAMMICAATSREQEVLAAALPPPASGEPQPALRCVDTRASSPASRAASLAREIRRFLGDIDRSSSEAFMVGGLSWHLAAAERAALALFTWSRVYFALSAASRSA